MGPQNLNDNLLKNGVMIKTLCVFDYRACLSCVSGRESSLVKPCHKSLRQILCQAGPTLLFTGLIPVLPKNNENMAMPVCMKCIF